MVATLIVAVTAFAAAAVNSIAGGGTFIMFPTLTGVAGLSEKLANITSTLGLWPGSASSVVAAKQEIARVSRGMLVAYCAISLVGGAAGAVLLLKTSTASFRLVIPWLLAFATAVFASSKPIARWAGRQQGKRTIGWSVTVGMIQLLVAVYGGYFGAGIGVLMLAGLSFAGLEDVHQMNGLKVLMATMINGVACAIFLFGKPDWRMVAVMAVSSVVGGFVGMAFARRLSAEKLRAMILLCGALLTVIYFVKNYRGVL